jgi:hypothetical protein
MFIRAVLYLEATLVLGLLYFAWHSSLESPTENYCTKNPQTGQEDCAAYDVTLVALLKLGRFFDDHNGAFVAVFTLALVISTVGLWIVTRQTAEATKANTDMIVNRERARFIASDTLCGIGIFANQPKADVVRCTISARTQFYNVGATPGLVGKTRIKVFIGRSLPERITLRDVPSKPYYFQIAILPQGTGGEIDIQMEVEMPRAEAIELERTPTADGRKMFVVGSLVFKDVFGVVRTFVFASKKRGNIVVPTAGEAYNREYEPDYEGPDTDD